jgi:hypothetical protein
MPGPGDPVVNPPASAAVPSYVPAQYQGWVLSASANTGLPVTVVSAQIDDESGFDPDAVSGAGAEGIAQFEPATWASNAPKGSSEFNVSASLTAYSNLMSSLLKQYGGNVRDALAAYNAGPGDLSAGYGYADAILARAGLSSSTTANPGPGGSSSTAGTSSPSSSSSTGGGLLAGFGSDVASFMTKAILTVALIGAGLWLAFVGSRGLVSYQRAPA